MTLTKLQFFLFPTFEIQKINHRLRKLIKTITLPLCHIEKPLINSTSQINERSHYSSTASKILQSPFIIREAQAPKFLIPLRDPRNYRPTAIFSSQLMRCERSPRGGISTTRRARSLSSARALSQIKAHPKEKNHHRRAHFHFPRAKQYHFTCSAQNVEKKKIIKETAAML